MDFAALAQECAPQVAHETMAAIVRTESAFQPLAIGVNGGARLARQPQDRAEAVATARWLIDNGYNIDLGLGQVNSSNLAKTGLTVEDAFEPCKNLAATASILRWNFQAASGKVTGEQAALHAALSAYNTGSFTKGFSNGYVQKVVNNAAGAPAAVLALPAPPTAPIALVGAPAVRLRAAAPGQAVRLTAQGPAPPPAQAPQPAQGPGANVYGDAVAGHSVMVY